MKKYLGSYWSYFFMYLFYYLSMALFSGLISVYLMDKGYLQTQVNLVVSCSMITNMIFQIIAGRLYDRMNKKVLTTILYAIAATMAIIFSKLDNLVLIAIVYSIVVACINSTNPVIEKMATTSRHKYGSIRIWGTIGYALGSKISGFLYQFISPESMYYVFSVGIMICILGVLGTQSKTETVKTTNIQKEKGKFNSQFIWYVIIACLFAGITNVHSTYLPTVLKEYGLSVDHLSTVLFLCTLMEFPVVLLGGKYINRLKNRTLLTILFTLELIQFATIAFVNYLPVQIVVIICTKSLCTMANIMINLKVVSSIVGSNHQISALSTIAATKSLTNVGFQTVGSTILQYWGSRVFYSSLIGVCLVAFLCIYQSKITDQSQENLF